MCEHSETRLIIPATDLVKIYKQDRQTVKDEIIKYIMGKILSYVKRGLKACSFDSWRIAPPAPHEGIFLEIQEEFRKVGYRITYSRGHGQTRTPSSWKVVWD